MKSAQAANAIEGSVTAEDRLSIILAKASDPVVILAKSPAQDDKLTIH
jgi:hypothetical protein